MSEVATQQVRSETPKVGYKNPPAHAKWKPGVSPNPGGKPQGSKNKLQGEFMRRLAADFERFGIYAIARVRRHDPASYVKVCASLMPKQFEISRPLDDIPDEQLDAAIAAVRAIFVAQNSGDGAIGAGAAQSPEVLPAVREAG